MNELDRAIGALLGLATGDAVGTTLEFQAPGSFAPIDDMVGGGPFRLAPGAWTDDTSMALCLAESILDTGTMDLHDQLRRYLLWKDDGYLSSTGRCFDIGITTRTQLERYRRTGEPVDPAPDENSAANGSLMRLAAVPIRWHADPGAATTQSADSSRATHPSRRPVDACRLMGAIISALIRGESFDDVTAAAFWQWGELHPEVAAVAMGGWRNKEPPEIRGTGYCIAALEAALWSVGGADDFRSAVLRAANLGDDADTTAAIAGQIAGARWGAATIPTAWRVKVVAGDRVAALARGLYAAGGGATESASWPYDTLVHAWWVQPGRLLAGEYPGHTDAVRARHKVDLLVDAGIRTFVDLTTPADRLDPYEPVINAVAAARQLDLRHVSFPIPDLGVVDDHAYDTVASTIEQGLERGGVYVHCWGGIGRTGTVVGCVLADEGLTYDEIIDRLATLRKGSRKESRRASEMPVQHELIKRRVAARRDWHDQHRPRRGSGAVSRADATTRRSLRVLAMVGELHKRGYQRIRISPGMSPSGMHWRCLVTPVDNILRAHGALVANHDEELVAFYTSGQENEYFGWTDARRATARQLADMFVERFPIIAARSLGEDWVYAGWFVQMLGVAESGYFPMAFNDWADLSAAPVLPTIGVGSVEGAPEIPLPPGGLADSPRF